MADEKDLHDVPIVSHDGKEINEKSVDHIDGPGRRGSVALNIVENPLKASFGHQCLFRGARNGHGGS